MRLNTLFYSTKGYGVEVALFLACERHGWWVAFYLNMVFAFYHNKLSQNWIQWQVDMYVAAQGINLEAPDVKMKIIFVVASLKSDN